MSIAPRVMVKFPSGSTWASTNDWDGHLDLVVSREFEPGVRDDGHGRRRAPRRPGRVPRVGRRVVGARRELPEPVARFARWSNGRASSSSRTTRSSSCRRTSPKTAASRRSSARSPTRRTSRSAASGRRRNGLFVHVGANYSFGTEGRTVGGLRHRAQLVGLRHPPRLAPGRDAAARARARDQGDDDGHEHRDAAAAAAAAPPPNRGADGDRHLQSVHGRTGPDEQPHARRARILTAIR